MKEKHQCVTSVMFDHNVADFAVVPTWLNCPSLQWLSYNRRKKEDGL